MGVGIHRFLGDSEPLSADKHLFAFSAPPDRAVAALW